MTPADSYSIEPETAIASPHYAETGPASLEMNRLGMWLFLATEVMFFGALFTAYIIYRYAYAEPFAQASRLLDVTAGTVNTAVLLTSSFTIFSAVDSIRKGRQGRLLLLLLVTMALGLVFLGIKGSEYLHKFQENLFPGPGFSYEGQNARPVQLFLSLYFIMTGLHAVHMVIGISVLGIMAFRAWRKHFSPDRYAPVELIALYWHFVDIVWIFLFPLLYLIDRWPK